MTEQPTNAASGGSAPTGGDPAPHRLVDGDFEPWMARPPYTLDDHLLLGLQPPSDEDAPAAHPPTRPYTVNDVVYENSYSRAVTTYADLKARQPLLRPVVPIPGDDQDALRAAATAAGDKTLATLAAALQAVEMRLDAGSPQPAAGGIILRDALVAGRPGSWEAMDLLTLTWTIGPAVTREHVDTPLLEMAADVFHRWATDPAGYVEFAATIPAVLAPLIDAGNGFCTVADPAIRYGDAGDRMRSWACSQTRRYTSLNAVDGYPELPRPAQQIDDIPDFRYPTPDLPLPEARTHLRAWACEGPAGADYGPVLAVVTEIGGGASITTAADALKAALNSRYAPAPVVVLEHWPPGQSYPDEEHLDQVEIIGDGPEWLRVWPTTDGHPWHHDFNGWVTEFRSLLPLAPIKYPREDV